jgi:hypothetical protein
MPNENASDHLLLVTMKGFIHEMQFNYKANPESMHHVLDSMRDRKGRMKAHFYIRGNILRSTRRRFSARQNIFNCYCFMSVPIKSLLRETSLHGTFNKSMTTTTRTAATLFQVLDSPCAHTLLPSVSLCCCC